MLHGHSRLGWGIIGAQLVKIWMYTQPHLINVATLLKLVLENSCLRTLILMFRAGQIHTHIICICVDFLTQFTPSTR